MRRQLDKFEDQNPQAKKRVNRIRRQIQKLEHELDHGESDDEVLDDINTDHAAMREYEYAALKKKSGLPPSARRVRTYNPDSSNKSAVRQIQQSAKMAIGYFNKQSPIRYCVVDFIKGTRMYCAGYLFVVTFAAKPEGGGEEPKTFEARVYHGIGRTEVQYVKIVDTYRGL
ncbi:hypothetical protein CASFOL_038450 [Castilleja foliolosa]|uniref:YDG domain-containing protein n=1 Tax=Castilleja foliolosa TaxID=1961234 RepID=A0ABD3BLU8_9LAMI